MDEDSHAAAQLSALAETTPDVLVTIDERSQVQYVNPAIEEVLGYRPSDVVGEPLTRFMSDALARRHDEAIDRYCSTGTRTVDWNGVDLPGQHRDGHEVPLRISFSEFTRDGDRYFTGIMRDVSERRRRAERLERLTEFGQDLLAADTVETACEETIATAEAVLTVPLVEVALYDTEAGRLRSVARTAALNSVVDETTALFGSERSLPWEAFVDDECRGYADRSTGTDLRDEDTPLESAFVVPIGPHGVLVVGDTEPDGVSGTDRRLARILASTVAGMLERLTGERELENRRAELQQRNEQYRRVQRLNGVIRDVTQVLLSATTRAQIKQFVCDRLAGTDPYRFVWFGEHDLTTDAVVPVAWAGSEDGYLDAVDVTSEGEPVGGGPAGDAVRNRTVRIRNDLQSDPPFEPWRQEATKRGYRSAISVPVVYRDTLYGVLTLYAGEADVFAEMEATVLTELGEMVGYGLNAMERYDALVAEESVELEFVIRDRENPMVELLSEHEGQFTLESIEERRETGHHVYLSFEGVPLDAIASLTPSSTGDDAVTVIRDTDEELIVGLTLPETALVTTLLDRGAVPTKLQGSPSEAHLTIRIPQEASVREFVELCEARYDDVELLARRHSTDPVHTVAGFDQAYTDRLTARQREVLRTAYYAGFFEQPRGSSARDVADVLDVSQPTVSRHIRAGEEALFSLLFDEN